MSSQEPPKSTLPSFVPPKTDQTVQFVRPREHEATYHRHHETRHIDPYVHQHHHEPSPGLQPSSNTQATQTPPAPLGVFKSFITQHPESIILKQRILSLTGSSFGVETPDGRGVLQIKGRILSLSGRKRVTDMQGNHLFDIRKKRTAMAPSFYAQSPYGKVFCKVTGKFSRGPSKSLARFHRPFTDKEEKLVIKGTFFDTSAVITNSRTGMVVARVDRKVLDATALSKRPAYVVEIGQGVDSALLVACAYVWMRSRKRGRSWWAS